MRDALVLREYTDAVKSGDSGRVVTVLKLWALSFRGSGRTKYAHEMLHLLHNLTHVWPAPLRKIVLQNWLVNPTGKPNAWVEVDLMQEHLNYWIKTIYKAHGSNASWEWLTMISPCVDILRQLVTRINMELGGRQGIKHTSPDLERDITQLMDSLADKGVYTEDPGRHIETDTPKSGACVPNAVGLGWSQLAGPLADFNVQLQQLQKRCTMTPLVGAPYTTTQPTTPSAQGPSGPSPTQAVPATLTNPLDASVAMPASTSDPSSMVQGLASTPDETLEDVHYWKSFESFSWEEYDADERARSPFSLDTAADVALDMDDLSQHTNLTKYKFTRVPP
ncbi:hypothetical protein VTO73DRAFT_10523 [Trametes versicolor]